jgi:thiol:disulfide interchange protein DsbD
MLERLLGSLEKVFAVSPILGLGASFLAGVLVSFSPCIYPLIPITLGISGAAASSTKLKGFFISIVFVSGVAAIYTFLGVLSSLAGTLLARFFINPVTYFILTIIFLFLGASYFGIVTLKIPVFSPQYDYGAKKGFLSIFILGILSGLAIIPCNFPVLGAILSLISLKKNILYGGFALFLFSFGYGAILIFLGTFAVLIRKLPKQGLWLIIIRKSLGLIFIIIGIYFLLKFINLIL